MKDMSPEEKRKYRKNLSIEELVITEKEYIYDLEVLVRVLHPFPCPSNDKVFIWIGAISVQVFLEPTKRNLADEDQPNKILDKKEFQIIFGNVERILEVSSCSLTRLVIASYCFFLVHKLQHFTQIIFFHSLF